MLGKTLRQTTSLPVGCYLALTLAVSLSVADNYLGRSFLLPLPPTVFGLLALFPLVVWIFGRDLAQGGAQILAIFRRNLPIVFPFLLVVFWSLFLSLHPTAYWKEDGKWIFLITYGFFIFLSAMLLPLLGIVRRRFHSFVMIAFLLLLGSIGYDLYSPGFFSTVVSRAAGFPGNSNFAALVVVMLCAVLLRYDFDRSRRSDLVILVLAGVGVFVTLSRSGILNYLLVVLLYARAVFFSGQESVRRGVLFLFASSILAAALATVIPLIIDHSMMFSQYRTRVSSFSSSEQIDDGSSQSRLRIATEALALVDRAPLLGHGTGYARRMAEPPHNIYLQQWVNNGVFGLVSYIFLLIGGYYHFSRHRYWPGKALILVTAFGGFFSHNILDQRPFLILLGTLATMALNLSVVPSMQQTSRRER